MNLDVTPVGNIPVAQRDSNIILYDHQKKASKKLSDWSRTAKAEPAGLLVLPTGGGKTLTATYWLMQNVLSKGKKVLWIAHQYTLLEQAYHSFEMVCCRNIAIGGKSSYSYRIVSGIHANARTIRPDDDILIASKASLSVEKPAFRNWLEKNRDNFYFIIDEAHHAPALGYRNLIRDMRQHGGRFFMLGLTATPFRTAEEEKGWMKKIFTDNILYGTSISNLTTEGILSKAKFRRIPTNIDMRKLFKDKNAEDIYNRIISNRKFDLDGKGEDASLAASLIAENYARNELIVKTYKDPSSNYGKTLVFALNRAMAKLLYECFKNAGVRANYVISGREDGQDNNAIINDFKADKFDVLINVKIVTEGVDVPNVKTVFLTRPTKSKILMTQMIGRGLRGQKVGGTEETFIVDFLDEWRDDLVAWVIPKELYDGEAIDFTQFKRDDSTGEPSEKELSEWEILHTISEGKLAEFIQLANSKFDLSLFEQFSLIERVPLGYYYFDYEVIGDDGEGEVRTCSVMVYDCMKSKFDELIDWLNNRPDKESFAVDSMVEAMAGEIDEKFFGEREELLGYDKENIRDLLRYYSQNEDEPPKFVEFAKRSEYDVSALAQYIIDAQLSRAAESRYIEDAWNHPDGKWKQFFGESNKLAFYNAINAELARKDGSLKKPTNSLTDEEIQTAQDVSLDVLVTRHSGIYEKIRDAVYESARENGEYVDSQSGRRSKSRLDFAIDYKTPLTAGGKTAPDNLQLVYIGSSLPPNSVALENMLLSEIKRQYPAQYIRICDAVYRHYQYRNGDYHDEVSRHRSDNRLDFKVDYEVPLSEGGKTVLNNLHLVYIGNSVSPPPPPQPPPVVDFKTVDELFNRLTNSTDGQEKLAIKNEIVAALSKLKETAQQKRDAVAMNQIGNYYGKIDKRDEAGRCYRSAKEFRNETPSSTTIIIPSAKPSGEPIPDTNLTWQLDAIGTLTISGKGDMKDWDDDEDPPWYEQRTTIKKVIIADGVTSIGKYTFSDCESLTSVAIPNSVTSIDEYAFSSCKSLTSVVIPDSVTSIGEAVFYCCTSLTEIKIPNSVTSIGKYAFCNCRSLTSVVIPDSVTSIGNGAFGWCRSLTSVTLPDNVFIIGAVFVSCTSLKKIDQPSKDFFCDNLFVYDKRSGDLRINSFIGTTSKVVVPDSVTSIGYKAFYCCTSLTEIKIPRSVTFIGGKAFEFCKSLTSVTLPDNIKNLDNITNFGEAVFVGCTSLKRIDQPSKVIFCDNSFVYEKAPEGIRINSFIGTTPTVAIPRSVTSIGVAAFEFCESLTNITIPPNITKIWGNIFNDCSNLKTIRYTKIYRNRMETLKRKLSTGNDAELILY